MRSADELALCRAVAAGDAARVQELLPLVRRAGELMVLGRSLLELAADLGYEEVVAALLPHHQQEEKEKEEAFRLACEGGHAEAATALATHVSSGAALRAAAGAGLAALVETLLGPGVDAPDKRGRTPLWVASEHGHEAAVSALLRGGASADSPDEDGWTPLLAASGNGHEAVVTALLRGGADVNLAEQFGWTPLLLASGAGHVAVVAALLAAGAEADVAHPDGRRPLLSASRYGHAAVVAALLAAGAEADLTDQDGRTPLWFAIMWGHLRVASMLRAAGADPARLTAVAVSGAKVRAYEAYREQRLGERYAFLAAMERLRRSHLSREVARFL